MIDVRCKILFMGIENLYESDSMSFSSSIHVVSFRKLITASKILMFSNFFCTKIRFVIQFDRCKHKSLYILLNENRLIIISIVYTHNIHACQTENDLTNFR